jgi:hypothetical protein
VVDRLQKEGRLVVWAGPDTLGALPASWVRVAGADHLRTALRRSPDGGSAVCHLLNRDYDAAADRVRPTGPLAVSIEREAIGNRLSRAVLHAPGVEPVPLMVARDAHRLTITVPSLRLWGVVELMP